MDPDISADFFSLEQLLDGDGRRQVTAVREFMEKSFAPVIDRDWIRDRSPRRSAGAAAVCGYFDQPHMHRDFAELGARTPGGHAEDPSPPQPGFGRFSTCTDNQGIPFGLHQHPPSEPPPAI